MSNNELETIGPAELARILHVSKSLIYKAASGHSPLSLPPRVKPLGLTRLLWFREDVLSWLRAHREPELERLADPAPEQPQHQARRRGRPRKQEVVAARARGAA